NKIEGPVAALDMEIWSPAIPQIKGTKPFQHIPFLFCVYGGDTSTFFLCEHQTDERRAFAENLIAHTKQFKTILAYDKGMEEQAVNGLVALYPELGEKLIELKNKLIDLSVIFKNL